MRVLGALALPPRFWFKFKLRGRQCRGTTRTANRQLAEQTAGKRRLEVLEAKTNRSSYKDQAVLDRLVASTDDRQLNDISPFHIERWKRERADKVSQSTVNRELNIVRGCFSRAVQWGRLGVSPLRTVKPYRVDECHSGGVAQIPGTGIRTTPRSPSFHRYCPATKRWEGLVVKSVGDLRFTSPHLLSVPRDRVRPLGSAAILAFVA